MSAPPVSNGSTAIKRPDPIKQEDKSKGTSTPEKKDTSIGLTPAPAPANLGTGLEKTTPPTPETNQGVAANASANQQSARTENTTTNPFGTTAPAGTDEQAAGPNGVKAPEPAKNEEKNGNGAQSGGQQAPDTKVAINSASNQTQTQQQQQATPAPNGTTQPAQTTATNQTQQPVRSEQLTPEQRKGLKQEPNRGTFVPEGTENRRTVGNNVEISGKQGNQTIMCDVDGKDTDADKSKDTDLTLNDGSKIAHSNRYERINELAKNSDGTTMKDENGKDMDIRQAAVKKLDSLKTDLTKDPDQVKAMNKELGNFAKVGNDLYRQPTQKEYEDFYKDGKNAGKDMTWTKLEKGKDDKEIAMREAFLKMNGVNTDAPKETEPKKTNADGTTTANGGADVANKTEGKQPHEAQPNSNTQATTNNPIKSSTDLATAKTKLEGKNLTEPQRAELKKQIEEYEKSSKGITNAAIDKAKPSIDKIKQGDAEYEAAKKGDKSLETLKKETEGKANPKTEAEKKDAPKSDAKTADKAAERWGFDANKGTCKPITGTNDLIDARVECARLPIDSPLRDALKTQIDAYKAANANKPKKNIFSMIGGLFNN